VTVRVAELDRKLFTATTPETGNSVPQVQLDGNRVLLHLISTGATGTGSVEITLNAKVRWHLRLTGGAVDHHLDLTGAKLSGVDFLGGATRIELTLPAPDATVPIRMSGGVNQFVLHVPGKIPVRVRAAKGASSLHVDVDAVAGFASLQVVRT
jgi:hypothetical protein